MEVRYGGNNPHKLVSSDELQYQDELTGYWHPVEVFEEPKPKFPSNDYVDLRWKEEL